MYDILQLIYKSKVSSVLYILTISILWGYYASRLLVHGRIFFKIQCIVANLYLVISRRIRRNGVQIACYDSHRRNQNLPMLKEQV